MTSTNQKYLVLAALLLALLIPFSSGFERPASPMDEGTLLVYPELILHGKVPYRDFETFYGPANIYALAAVYQVAGPDVLVERTVGLTYRLLLLAALFLLLQRWGLPLAAGCTALAGFCLTPLELTAYAWLGGIACALWGLWLSSGAGHARRCFFGGLLAATALLFRPDQGPAVLLSFLPLFLLMENRARVAWVAGAAVGLLPLLIVTFLAGPAPVFQNLFLFPVLHCNPGRRLPFSAVEGMLLNLFALEVIAVALNLLAGIIAVRAERRSADARLLLSFGLFGLGLLPQTMQRIDHTHLCFSIFIVFGLLPVSIARLAFWSRDHGFLPTRTQALLAVVSVLAAVETVFPDLATYYYRRVRLPFFSAPTMAIFLNQNGRTYPIAPTPDVPSLVKILDQLQKQSTPGQRLFVGPGDLRCTNVADTFIYYLMPQLTPASYFLEMNPFSANRPDSRLAADVASADWLVLNHLWDNLHEANESGRYGPAEPNEIVRTQFELCARERNFDLYRRKGAPGPASGPPPAAHP